MRSLRFSTLCGLGLAVALLGSTVACTSGADSPKASHVAPRSGDITHEVAAPGPSCVDTANLDMEATSGRIHAGPFGLNQGYWTQPQGTKLWVGSSRAGSASAVIRGKRLDGAGRFQQRRTVDQRGTVPTLPVFYPGAVRLPSAGRWRLTVRIGPDQGCFDVAVTA